MAVFCLAALVACGGADDLAERPPTATTPSTTIVQSRPTLVDEEAPDWFGEVVNLHDLGAEACFNRYSWTQNDRNIQIDTVVPCTGPHQFEIYHLAEHPARQGSPWPGDREMEAFATAECYDAFADFVGTIYELSALELGFLTPSRASFEHDVAQFRGVHCYVFREDGVELTESAGGSLR